MIVVISRIRVVSDHADAVAEQYRRRSRLVEGAEGFLGMEVLRSQDRPHEFWVCTRWTTSEAYEAYRKGSDFRAAHANVAAIPGVVKIDKASHFVERFDVLAD